MGKNKIKRLSITAMLGALGIIIPLLMPKITLGDAASYTLASHVPIFIAMFLGPDVAFFVGIATTFGFFISLSPIVAARAFSHLFWAVPFAFYFRKKVDKPFTLKNIIIMNVIIAAFHALFESITVAMFFAKNLRDIEFLLKTILLPIGIGGFVHSIVDYVISVLIFKRISVKFEDM